MAALNGHAIGGGLEVALSCDLRIAANGVKLGMPPAKLGLVYSHTGIRKFLDVIGAARTRELFLVGSNVDAETAEWSLVNESCPAPSWTSARWRWRARSPATRRCRWPATNGCCASCSPHRAELDPDIEDELVELRAACFQSEDFREGVRAFGEKRRPRWQGR